MSTRKLGRTVSIDDLSTSRSIRGSMRTSGSVDELDGDGGVEGGRSSPAMVCTVFDLQKYHISSENKKFRAHMGHNYPAEGPISVLDLSRGPILVLDEWFLYFYSMTSNNVIIKRRSVDVIPDKIYRFLIIFRNE